MAEDTQWLYQLLADVQLEKFYLHVRDGLNITRIEHFSYVKESDLEQIGISKPAQRRLWDALKCHKINSRSRMQESGGRTLPCLIQDNELLLGEKLGSGSFGVVKKGEWHTPAGRVVRDYFTNNFFFFSQLLLSFAISTTDPQNNQHVL